MMLVKNREMRTFAFFHDNGEKLLEWSFLADELVWFFYTDQVVSIKKEEVPFLYEGLDAILHSTYQFSNPFCKQEGNKIVWFSDQTCDLEDERQTDTISRLTIEKVGEEIQLSVLTPFCVKNGIKRTQSLVAFSPGGNGFWSKSEERGETFQTDIALLFTMSFQECLPNEDEHMQLLMRQGKL